MTNWQKNPEYCEITRDNWWSVTDGEYSFRCSTEKEADFIISTLSQSQAQSSIKGYKWVPVEPTQEMLDAVRKPILDSASELSKSLRQEADAARIEDYRAMIDAAPKFQSGGIPPDWKLVPVRMNQAMRDVTDTEGWAWEDLLAAAEAITENEHAALRSLAQDKSQPGERDPVTFPPFSTWSPNEGDSWYDCPTDAQIIEDVFGGETPMVGAEYEVSAGWRCVTATYRITLVSEDGDCEAECISHPQENFASQPVAKGSSVPPGHKGGPAPIERAVYEAVSAIYLADNSDYLPALWSIVRCLSPDLAQLLERDERAAWLKANERKEQASLAASSMAMVEQKPVAEVYFDTNGWRKLIDALVKLPDGTHLYANHPKGEKLTDAQRKAILWEVASSVDAPSVDMRHWNCVALAIERAVTGVFSS